MGYAQLAIAAYGAYQAYKNKPSDEGKRIMQQAMAQLQSVPVPDPESLKVQMQQFVQQGLIAPQDADAILVQHNAYDEVRGNDQARGAQLAALQGFQDQGNAGGLTDTSRAAIQSTLDEVANTERGQRQAIGQDARRRGISGSGLELAQQLMAQQSSADQAGRQGMDIAALAEQSKIEALKNAANVGTTIQGQDLDAQGAKAEAANQIAMYNATNQQDVTLKNIAARNLAQEQNLQAKQNISNANTKMENDNRLRNADLIQKAYENRMDKAKAVANAAGGVASETNNYNNANRQYQGDLTAGILKTVGDYGSSGGFQKTGTDLRNTGTSIMNGLTSAKNKINDWLSPTGVGGFNPNDRNYIRNNKQQGNIIAPGYAHGGKVKDVPCYDDGGKVPGNAQYPGDDERNDTVLAKLSPGEVVIPRSQADDIDVDAMLNDAPRTAQKPSVDAVKVMLQALTEMGC